LGNFFRPLFSLLKAFYEFSFTSLQDLSLPSFAAEALQDFFFANVQLSHPPSSKKTMKWPIPYTSEMQTAACRKWLRCRETESTIFDVQNPDILAKMNATFIASSAFLWNCYYSEEQFRSIITNVELTGSYCSLLNR